MHPTCQSSVPSHVGVEDDLLHTMVEDLLARQIVVDCEDDCPSVENKKEEDVLLQHARTPLYKGCTYSTLRALLKILNLQAMLGWSNASVDALIKKQIFFNTRHMM